jgi:hypothetical protein
MTGRSSSDKGKRAEREVVALIAEHLGIDARRTLAGHRDDLGDIVGLPSTTVEVKNLASLSAAINEGLQDLAKEQANAGQPFGVLFARRRGGRFVACMEPEQFFALWREATA